MMSGKPSDDVETETGGTPVISYYTPDEPLPGDAIAKWSLYCGAAPMGIFVLILIVAETRWQPVREVAHICIWVLKSAWLVASALAITFGIIGRHRAKAADGGVRVDGSNGLHLGILGMGWFLLIAISG